MTDSNKPDQQTPDRAQPVSAEEIAVYRQLKPLIAHCLTLNHEINNPLAGILGYAEFMLDADDLNDEQRRHVQQIMTSAERIRKIIEKLSDRKIKLSDDVEMGKLIEQFKRAAEESY